MSTAPENSPFAPHIAHVEDVASGGQELAGRGARLGAGLAGLRNALGFVLRLVFRALHKCLHDSIADTIVVKA